MVRYFVGIDVQVTRGCAYYIIDTYAKFVANGWFGKDNISKLLTELHLLSMSPKDEMAIGIDAPRLPLEKLRNRQWDRKKKQWVEKGELLNGRECEVLINTNKLANCQWTRLSGDCPEWMHVGFSLFKAFDAFPHLYEVFPSASYTMFEKSDIRVEVSLKNFKHGVKDMIDAATAAVTVKEFVEGRGCAVGGEDGLGAIILPGKI